MKNLILGIAILTSVSSFAGTTNFGTNNEDITSISITESNLADCEKNLSNAIELLEHRQKMIYKKVECKQLGKKFHGAVSYHKYL